MPVSSIDQQNTTPQRKSNTGKAIGAGIIGGGAVGAATYFLLPNEITPQKLLTLDNDKFQKTFSKVPEDKKEIVDYLLELKDYAKTGFENSSKEIDSIFVEGKEIQLNNFVEVVTDGKAKSIKEFEELINSEEFIGEDRKLLLNELKKYEKSNTITKENALDIVKNMIKGETENSIKESLTELGDNLPKIKSGKKAAIFGAIAAVLTGIVTAIVSKHHQSDK